MRSIEYGHDIGAGGKVPARGPRYRDRALLRPLLIGVVVMSSIVLAACGSGSSQDANHQTCKTVRVALSDYNNRNYPAWRADLAQAGQIAQNATDSHLRSLAQRAATESSAPAPTTTTAPPVRGKGAIDLNLNLQNVASFAALKAYCQSSYPS